jgi:phosphoesterase RecJ-like protein
MDSSSKDLVNAVAAELAAADSFIVISHANPDIDALGSQLALAAALEAQGKTVCCVNESSIPASIRFLPGTDRVKRQIETSVEHFDTIIVCDCATAKRAGDSFVSALKSHSRVINIDHHVSNEFFGTINLVMASASSTSEIVYELLLRSGRPLSTDIALCLFAGIAGDTGFFRYSSTSAYTFQVAKDLVDAGAVPYVAAQELYGNTPLVAVKLHAEVCRSIETDLDGRFTVGIVTADMLGRLGALPEHTENLVEKLRDIQGVQVAALARQENGNWKVSLRSSTPNCNVSEIAANFGGGGHKMAAAFRTSESLEVFVERLRRLVGDALDGK